MRLKGLFLILCLIIFTFTGCAGNKNSSTPINLSDQMQQDLSGYDWEILAEPIYFESNSFNIDSDYDSLLQKKSAILRNSPKLKIRIAGNCDKYGSEEYNYSLGLSRANTVKKYFTNRGINKNNIEIISYGSSRPASDVSTLNRRVNFAIIEK